LLPTVAAVREAVVTVSAEWGLAAATEIANCFAATLLAESVALTVKEELAGDMGTPEITPVEAARPKPAGKVPVERLQV
jgi:hypothetical protein